MVSDIDSTPPRFGGAFDGNRGRAFVATALFVAFASFVALSEGNRGYEANLSVFVMPGTASSSVPKDVVENVVFLSRTAEFRTMFFRDAESVPGLMATEDVSEMSGDMIRKSFDSMLSIVPTGTGSMITVRAYADDPDDAKNIARTSALALFRYASRYYDVDREADFRIVDGPSVVTRLPNGFLLIFGSGAIGIAVAGVLFLSVSLAKSVFATTGRRKMPLPSNPFGADIFQPKRPVSPLLSDTVSEEVSGRVTESQNPSVETPVSERETESGAGGDYFFEPEPAKRPDTSGSATRVMPKAPVASAIKQAPAPLDIPTYSEEEERFLKEFTFEEFEGGENVREEIADMGEERIAVPAAVQEVPVTAAATPIVTDVSATEELLPAESHPAPTKSDYQRRLNELLRS